MTNLTIYQRRFERAGWREANEDRFALDATRATLLFYRPAEEPAYNEWYRREISESLRRFA